MLQSLDMLELLVGHFYFLKPYHSGLVTPVSITVPGGGLARLRPLLLKNFALILFLTITHANLGL